MKNNNYNKQKGSKGITLIALVITIIVLLILAGISISMLSGDNSILQKATTSKENTERTQIVENARLDVLAEITENQGNNLQESQLKDVLKKYFVNSEIPEELPSDLSKIELTALNGIYKIKVSEIYDGKFTKQSGTIFAKDTLIINTSASTDAEKSPYVNYPSSKGKILCRVLYGYDEVDVNEQLYGMQIISVNSVANVKLGIEDKYVEESITDNYSRAESSYENVIDHLNKYSEEYLDKNGIASSSRCVGTNPVNRNITGSYLGEDGNRLQALDALVITGKNYWWAHTMLISTQGYGGSGVISVPYSPNILFDTQASGQTANYTGYTKEKGLRPIFVLNSNVKILSGDGTIESPYEIGL